MNFTDPTGHASQVDDGGNSHECPANTCYIELVGSTPGMPLYPVSPVTYGENIEGTSSGGGLMDGATLPDVIDPSFTVKSGQSGAEPSAGAGAVVVGIDLAIQLRNAAIYSEPNINLFVFYKINGKGYSVDHADIQNNSEWSPLVSKVGLEAVSKGQCSATCVSAAPAAYLVVPGTVSRNLRVPANGTTTISLIPSGNNGNPTNTFYSSQRVQIGVTMLFPFFNNRSLDMKFVPIIADIQGP